MPETARQTERLRAAVCAGQLDCRLPTSHMFLDRWSRGGDRIRNHAVAACPPVPHTVQQTHKLEYSIGIIIDTCLRRVRLNPLVDFCTRLAPFDSLRNTFDTLRHPV